MAVCDVSLQVSLREVAPPTTSVVIPTTHTQTHTHRVEAKTLIPTTCVYSLLPRLAEPRYFPPLALSRFKVHA